MGCGAGFFLRALDSKKWDRFGVETSAAAAKATEAAIGSGHVFTGTLTMSSWEAARFDVITFWSALEHTNEPRINLSEARRIVKPGGTLIVQLPNAASYCFVMNLLGFPCGVVTAGRVRAGEESDRPASRDPCDTAARKVEANSAGLEIYRTTYFSKAHNSHALKHSLKTRLLTKSSSAINHGLFYLSVPFVKPFDIAMSAFGKGATLTLAARAV